VTVVNAGHLSPLLYRKSGAVESPIGKKETGVPLGIDDGVSFTACQIPLEPGDSLILYTDGIPDALDVRGAQFGPKGIHAALGNAGGATPKQLAERMVKAVQTHAAGRSPHDDHYAGEFRTHAVTVARRSATNRLRTAEKDT